MFTGVNVACFFCVGEVLDGIVKSFCTGGGGDG